MFPNYDKLRHVRNRIKELYFVDYCKIKSHKQSTSYNTPDEYGVFSYYDDTVSEYVTYEGSIIIPCRFRERKIQTIFEAHGQSTVINRLDFHYPLDLTLQSGFVIEKLYTTDSGLFFDDGLYTDVGQEWELIRIFEDISLSGFNSAALSEVRRGENS